MHYFNSTKVRTLIEFFRSLLPKNTFTIIKDLYSKNDEFQFTYSWHQISNLCVRIYFQGVILRLLAFIFVMEAECKYCLFCKNTLVIEKVILIHNLLRILMFLTLRSWLELLFCAIGGWLQRALWYWNDKRRIAKQIFRHLFYGYEKYEFISPQNINLNLTYQSCVSQLYNS